MSDYTKVENLKLTKEYEKKLKREQRKLSRRYKLVKVLMMILEYMEKLEFLFFVKIQEKLKDIDIQNHKHQHMAKLDLNIFFRRNK